jgi:hypothetical protein
MTTNDRLHHFDEVVSDEVVMANASSVLGLGLRLVLFWGATHVVRGLANAAGRVLPLLPDLDPVYSRTAVQSLGDVQIQGLAIGGAVGHELHLLLPSLVVILRALTLPWSDWPERRVPTTPSLWVYIW